jgi:hypothetical protein
MNTTTSNLAIAEPLVRTVVPQRDRADGREQVSPSELSMLRERVRRMRLPRGEFVPHLPR